MAPRADAVAARSSRTVRQAAKLEAALVSLEAMDLDALRARWQGLTGRAAPATFRILLLRAAVAYKLQERVHGRLKVGTRSLLHRVADAADPSHRVPLDGDASVSAALAGLSGFAALASSDETVGDTARPVTSNPGAPSFSVRQRRAPSLPLRIKPGTRLLRTWQGSTHEVLVGTDAVSYRGQQYRSLSEVARLITGQRWSGPLFFGLKRRSAPPGPAEAEPAQ